MIQPPALPELTVAAGAGSGKTVGASQWAFFLAAFTAAQKSPSVLLRSPGLNSPPFARRISLLHGRLSTRRRLHWANAALFGGRMGLRILTGTWPARPHMPIGLGLFSRPPDEVTPRSPTMPRWRRSLRTEMTHDLLGTPSRRMGPTRSHRCSRNGFGRRAGKLRSAFYLRVARRQKNSFCG